MSCLVGFMCYFFNWKIISLLKEKRLDPDFSVPEINEADIYLFDPSELPGLSETKSDDQTWYFFCEPYYKYSKSKRAHRTTGGGYWKITGKGCPVKDRAGKLIGSKKTLVFYRRGLNSKKLVKTDWVMHEFYVEDTDNTNFKKDFVVCYIEKKPNNKSNVSTPDDGQTSHSLSSDSESHVTENLSTEVEPQQPSSHHLISDSRKHITKNSFLEVESQLLSSDNLVSDSRKHFLGSTCPTVESQLPSSDNLVSDTRKHFPGSTCSTVESQLPSSDILDYDIRIHFPESTSPMVDPQLLAKLGAINGCNLVNDSSFSALQSPINPDHGSNSSYSNGISNYCNMLDYQSGSEEDVHSRRDVLDDYPGQMTALSDSDIEAFINELLP